MSEASNAELTGPSQAVRKLGVRSCHWCGRGVGLVCIHTVAKSSAEHKDHAHGGGEGVGSSVQRMVQFSQLAVGLHKANHTALRAAVEWAWERALSVLCSSRAQEGPAPPSLPSAGGAIHPGARIFIPTTTADTGCSPTNCNQALFCHLGSIRSNTPGPGSSMQLPNRLSPTARM
jgi:hypothetical protein